MAVAANLHARRAEMLHATKLVALDKGGGGQLRPTCVSTMWVKLISYPLLPARECLDPHLHGRQSGVGTSQGATAPEHVAVQLDLKNALFRKAPDTFNFLRHVMRAIWSVRPKCSHRCVSLKEPPLKHVQSLKHTTKNSAEQTVMRTKWFKHIAI